MKRVLVVVTMLLAIACVAASFAHAAITPEEGGATVITFRGDAFFVPPGGDKPIPIPFDFNITCVDRSDGTSAGVCSGGLTIRYGSSTLARGTRGTVITLDPPFPMDTYQVTVASRDGSFACTLTSFPPITSGPTNTVRVSCAMPSGTATTDSAVVVVRSPLN